MVESTRRRWLRLRRATADGGRPTFPLVVSALIATGCGASAPKRVPPSHWLSANPQRKSVLLRLSASGNRSTLGAFNGYSRGQVLVEIPTGWRVTVRCVNAAPLTRHACAVTANSLATRPAFRDAATPNPSGGLQPGGSATFSFLATRPGVYRLASLVDDDEIGNGLWDTLQVGSTSRPQVKVVRASP